MAGLPDAAGPGRPDDRVLDPVTIATEGALWGAVVHHGLLQNAVIVSDDAGRFRVGTHALCRVHAERLVHKPIPTTPSQVAVIESSASGSESCMAT